MRQGSALCPARREYLKWLAALSAGSILPGCSMPEPAIRVGSNGWPGYLFLEWAAVQNYFPASSVRVVRMPAATLVMQALVTGTLEAACLTLDEVIDLCAENVPLKVVAVLDVSAGADVLLGRGDVVSLAQLSGKRVGVEQTAVGALMLEAALQQAGLAVSQVKMVPMLVDRHEAAFREGEVDALVTFEPVASRLLASGATRLFSSADIPGRIIDVLAVHESVLSRSPRALRVLLDGHFFGVQQYAEHHAGCRVFIAKQLNVSETELDTMYHGMSLPDRRANQQWLGGSNTKLDQSAMALASDMHRSGLLTKPFTRKLAVADFLQGGTL